MHENSYHLAVRASRNWFSRMILTSLKIHAYRDNLGAFEVRYLIASAHVRLTKKKKYLADSMDLKLTGLRFHVTCYVPSLFNIQNSYTLPTVWIYGSCMYLRGATFAVCNTIRLVFISEMWSVYCAVRSGPLNK
jgi:hypothetical protein